jgi:hypothetical protein
MEQRALRKPAVPNTASSSWDLGKLSLGILIFFKIFKMRMSDARIYRATPKLTILAYITHLIL